MAGTAGVEGDQMNLIVECLAQTYDPKDIAGLTPPKRPFRRSPNDSMFQISDIAGSRVLYLKHNIGAVAGEIPIDVHFMMDNNQKLFGSQRFTTAEGQEMADMVASGVADLSILETNASPVEKVNEAISGCEPAR